MYKVKYALLDLTVPFKGRICNSRSFVPSDPVGFSSTPVWLERQKRCGCVFHWNLGEVWSLIVGDIKPS